MHYIYYLYFEFEFLFMFMLVNEGESVLPLNVRFKKVADKLMEFSRSSGIPEVPSGSRQLSEVNSNVFFQFICLICSRSFYIVTHNIYFVVAEPLC